MVFSIKRLGLKKSLTGCSTSMLEVWAVIGSGAWICCSTTCSEGIVRCGGVSSVPTCTCQSSACQVHMMDAQPYRS